MSEDNIQSRISKQIEILISLVGRIAVAESELKELITKGSKKPSALLNAYNLCTGQWTITEISKKAGIAQSSMTNAVKKWEGLGVAYKIEEDGQVYPFRLYPLKS